MTSFDVVSGAVVSVLRGEAAATQNVEAEVAAAFGPLVVLLGEHGPDEADDTVAFGKDPDGSVSLHWPHCDGARLP